MFKRKQYVHALFTRATLIVRPCAESLFELQIDRTLFNAVSRRKNNENDEAQSIFDGLNSFYVFLIGLVGKSQSQLYQLIKFAHLLPHEPGRHRLNCVMPALLLKLS